MQKTLFVFSISFLLPALLFGSTKKMKVLIDAGHGGEDHGAVHNGVVEKELCLSVSKELLKLLKQDSRFEAVMSRENDSFIALDQRSQKAEQNKVDVFISIHANSSQVASARGTEIYFENQIPTDEESMLTAARENSAKSAKANEYKPEDSDLSNILNDLSRSRHMTLSSVLSQHLLESLQKDLKIKTRSIRQAPFHVLSVSMPATLIELGFLTNAKEAQWLALAETQKKFAQSIHHGLITYKEKLDKTPSKP